MNKLNYFVSLELFGLTFSSAVYAEPLTVDSSQWDATDITFPESTESILFPPNPRWEELSDFRENSLFRKASSAVGRLKIKQENGAVGLCTAFLVGDGQLITNYHCVPGIGNVAEVVLEMGYYLRSEAPKKYSVERTPIVSHRGLDVSLLQVKGNPDDEWGVLSFASSDISEGESLFIVHHPAGQTKKVSREGCFSGPDRGLRNGHFLHQCDTIGGSSGSPIFFYDGTVAGIHHRGTPDRGDDAYNKGTKVVSAASVFEVMSKEIESQPPDLLPTTVPVNSDSVDWDFPHIQLEGAAVGAINVRASGRGVDINMRMKNTSDKAIYVKLAALSYTDSNGNVCQKGSFTTSASGIAWRSNHEPTELLPSGVIQFSGNNIRCDDNSFTASGDVLGTIAIGVSPDDVVGRTFELLNVRNLDK